MKSDKSYKESLTNGEKMAAFDKIADMFYDRNFGMATKTDIELLMFSIYMDAMIRRDSEKIIDGKNCSDSVMARALGVPQAKIRTLKEKKIQRYSLPKEFNWVEELSKLIKYATYNDKTGYIELNIPDRNLYLAIQDHIENQGGALNITLNSKLLSVRPEYFVELAVRSETEEGNREKIVKNLREMLLENHDTELELDATNLSDLISKKKSVDIKKVLSCVGRGLSSTNAYLSIITALRLLILG